MARRRLDLSALISAQGSAPGTPQSASKPPIATVAGEAAALSAADDITAELASARKEGRLAVRLPLDLIDPGHFARDRIAVDDDEMESLKASLAAHGQRMPIEVMAGEGDRYALISGWRRLSALTGLFQETKDERFASVLAIVRTPADAGSAYVAMVEENEIRVGLSYYERARIAALATERGAFESADAAINALFASGSKAKRSKIRSFLSIHEALGGALRFPQAMSERVGLAVAGGLKEGLEKPLLAALKDPAETAEGEAVALLAALKSKVVSRAKPESEALRDGVTMTVDKRGLALRGPGVTEALIEKIRAAVKDA